jgi:transposase
MKIIKGTSRQQMHFSSFDDLIAADNPVRILDAFVEKLDPIAIGLVQLGIRQGTQSKPGKSKVDPGGAPRFDDKLMLKLYLYGYLNKIRSSRKPEQESRRNVELRWLFLFPFIQLLILF